MTGLAFLLGLIGSGISIYVQEGSHSGWFSVSFLADKGGSYSGVPIMIIPMIAAAVFGLIISLKIIRTK